MTKIFKKTMMSFCNMPENMLVTNIHVQDSLTFVRVVKIM